VASRQSDTSAPAPTLESNGWIGPAIGDVIEARPGDRGLNALVTSTATRLGLSERSLLVQGLLYLPRLCGPDWRVGRSEASRELDRIGRRISERVAPYRHWLVPTDPAPRSPTELYFDRASEAETRIVLERFHYLASFRADARGHALRGLGGRIVALATLSAMDLPMISRACSGLVSPHEVLILSRVFAFDWAPRNTISYLLGDLVAMCRRERPDIRLLLTYLNPNLGFNGTSYRASNWRQVGEESGTRYSYVDESYVTDRELARRYGTADPQELGKLLGSRYSVTEVPLEPLRLYGYVMDPALGAAIGDRQFRSERQ
jgi:hypothetical protein